MGIGRGEGQRNQDTIKVQSGEVMMGISRRSQGSSKKGWLEGRAASRGLRCRTGL